MFWLLYSLNYFTPDAELSRDYCLTDLSVDCNKNIYNCLAPVVSTRVKTV